MLTRKAFKSGSSLVVALPVDWTKREKVRKGSMIEVELVEGQGLLIKPIRKVSTEPAKRRKKPRKT